MDKQQEKIAEIAEEIMKQKKVIAVYLFGSFARGATHEQSDIDICVIGERGKQMPIFEKEGYDIISFWDLPLPIRFRVLREGKLLAVKNAEYIRKVKLETLRDYLDIKPLINRYLWERFACTI